MPAVDVSRPGGSSAGDSNAEVAPPGRRRAFLVREFSALTGACCMVAGLAGCATGERVNDRVRPETPLWYTHRGGAISPVFSRELTAESRLAGESYETGRAEIDATHGRVFVGSSDHGLYAIRASSGGTLWRFETVGPVQSEPLYDAEHDVVFFGSNDGALYAVRAMNGDLLWRYQTEGVITRQPVLHGETVYFANGSDTLFAVDRTTGKARWQVHRPSALGMEIAGYAGPTVADGKVYIGYSDGHVGAYDAKDGSERWTPVDLAAEAEQQAGGDTPRYLDVDTTPIVESVAAGLSPSSSATRVVFVAGYAGGVYALDAETGARVWSNDQAKGVTQLHLWKQRAHEPSPWGPYAGGPAVPAQGVLVASSSMTGLWGLDPATGRALWRNKLPDGGIGQPATVAGALVVGTTRYGLFLMSPINGKVIDGIDVGTGITATPAAHGTRAFVLTNTGRLLGLHVSPPVYPRIRGEAFVQDVFR